MLRNMLDATDRPSPGSPPPSSSLAVGSQVGGVEHLRILHASPGEDTSGQPTTHVAVRFVLSGRASSCTVALDRHGDSLGIIGPSDLPDWAADEIEQAAVDAADLVDSLGWKALDHVNRVRLRDAGRAGVK